MYHSKIKSDVADRFVAALLSLENEEECYRFIEDILSVSEFRSICQRLEVARLLREGKTFTAITGETGASAATIARVNRSLLYGSDGYKLVIERQGRGWSL